MAEPMTVANTDDPLLHSYDTGGNTPMAEVSHPVRLLQHIGWVIAGKVESVLRRFERRVREEYQRTGPRDQ